jgi:ankyrin repeat protein
MAAIQGGDVNERDTRWFGDTPLHLAALENQVEAIQKLVLLGADVNSQNQLGYTPLHYAVMEGNRKAVKKLLMLGADVKAVNGEGRTPVQEAQFRGHLICSDIILSFAGFGNESWQDLSD